MGLASALSTALTGLTAAETQIDVVGNNLANAQTVGFKESTALFATQFLQTLSLGGAPSATQGGTNPRQTGLGTQVASISPNYSQGTIEISSNPSDLAIQGDGFFMVAGNGGEQLYTRNGIFRTNSNNELVTITGHRLLGYGVDDSFNIQTSQVSPLTIPLGAAAVAQATENVALEGLLTPTGDIAEAAEIIESDVLGNSAVPAPAASSVAAGVAAVPAIGAETINHTDSGGALQEGQTYRYRLAFVDDGGQEGVASNDIVVTIPAGNAIDDNQVTLDNLPSPNSGQYVSVNVYRTSAGGTTDFTLIGNTAIGGPFTDDGTAPAGAALDTTTINGNYSYYVTYHLNGSPESRPSSLIGPANVVDGRIQLTDLPTPPTPPPGGGFPAYDQIRIYRNLSSDSSTFYLVDTVAPGTDYTDTKTDAEISDLTNPNNKQIDLDGPKIDSNSLLVDVIGRNGSNYENLFEEGQLSFTGRKGERQLAAQEFTVTNTSTVQDLIDFMHESMGIRTAADDPQNPIPGSLDLSNPGSTTQLGAGGSINNGRIRFVSNNGVDNALDVDLSAFQLQSNSGSTLAPSLGFGSVQSAVGESSVADFVVYDTLGVPLNVRLTTALESRTDTLTTYRWFADSAGNDPLQGTDISVGTGLISFDGSGNFVGSTNNEVSIDRRNIPSNTPLAFDLDFSTIAALAVEDGQLAARSQDGFPPGTLSSYVITEGGLIRGVFTNGASRDLGAIRLVRFTNPGGLEQRGQNLLAAASNSGLPIEGDPGQNGLGGIIAGAVELSNTDIGQNLIDLIVAQTQYRGNTRVVSAAQQMLDELLNLRR